MSNPVLTKDRYAYVIRVTPAVEDAVKLLADREQRSLNNLTNILLEEALRARGALPAETDR